MMKIMKSPMFLAILAVVVMTATSCQKNGVLPVQAASVATASIDQDVKINDTTTVVTFSTAQKPLVHLSQGLNSLANDTVMVSETNGYLTKYQYLVSGDPVVNTSSLTFYVNGGEVRATITYQDNVLTVALRKAVVLPIGQNIFLLQGRVHGLSGSSFSVVATTEVFITNSSRFAAQKVNFPTVEQNFVFN